MSKVISLRYIYMYIVIIIVWKGLSYTGMLVFV